MFSLAFVCLFDSMIAYNLLNVTWFSQNWVEM